METATRPKAAWDLTLVPNYASAPTVATEAAEGLTIARFRDRYVGTNTPCLIKGAVAAWPAVSKWAEAEYLVEKFGRRVGTPRTRPRLEAFGLRTPPEDARVRELDAHNLHPPIEYAEILRRLSRPDDEVLIAEEEGGNEVTSAVQQDIRTAPEGPFPFLRDPPRARLMYGSWNVMFYKNSYSDWHFHPGAEAIMCQIKGTKDVLLLPPNGDSWERLVSVHTRELHLYDVDRGRFPGFFGIHPYHVVVEAGDGLFIPVHWWHVVQARPEEWGITMPIWWQSRFLDLGQPATRYFLSYLWRHSSRKLAAAMLLQCSWATARIRLKPATA